MNNGNSNPLPGGGQQYGQNINNFGQAMPGQAPIQPTNGVKPNQPEKKDRSGLIKTIALIFVSIIAIVFAGLFAYMYVQWNDASTAVDTKINLAVAESENKLRTDLENEFAEKEKYPFSTFTGPTDYGTLTFEFPKTWSVYVPNDASNRGTYEAHVNPGVVNVVSPKTVMALRISIQTISTDTIKKKYADKVKSKKMTVETTVVNGVTVDIYHGELDSRYIGYVCVFKMRDKTVILQTDAELFKADFDRILSTIRYVA